MGTKNNMKKIPQLKHVELFAGCGGMTLGLEKSGFELYFANELSPMAGETFSYNIIGEDLNNLVEIKKEPKNVLWIRSNFEKKKLKERLRENPFTYDNGKFSDIDKNTNLKRKLLIGNIDHLLSFLSKNKSICNSLRNENIDLVSGGPPCQSFSLAGRREKDNKKNLLPLSFARFAGIVKPKIVLLENVKGITSPFTIVGEKYYAWVEVAKAFCLEGFVPFCMMVNSKYFGVPQNRPRFILLALRIDILNTLLEKEKDNNTLNILNESLGFYNLVLKNKKKLKSVSKNDLKLFDIEKQPYLFNGNILPRLLNSKDSFVSAEDAIDDLSFTNKKVNPSRYVTSLNKQFESTRKEVNYKYKNHEIRKHSFNVMARFRWFQIISNLNGLTPQALKLLSSENLDASEINLIFEKIKAEEVLVLENQVNKLGRLIDVETFTQYLKSIQTKKHSQQAIKPNEPAPAQLTIPDDLCHYSKNELRTLTVREMARFQSFPDWFEFKSKITTGGKQRSYEVPQYTQVGNAVPPLLAKALGEVVKDILIKIEN